MVNFHSKKSSSGMETVTSRSLYVSFEIHNSKILGAYDKNC